MIQILRCLQAAPHRAQKIHNISPKVQYKSQRTIIKCDRVRKKTKLKKETIFQIFQIFQALLHQLFPNQYFDMTPQLLLTSSIQSDSRGA